MLLTGEGKTEANEETSTDEHADALRGRLEGNRNTHDERADEDSPTTTKAIGEVRCEGISASMVISRRSNDVLEPIVPGKGTDILNRVE